MKVNENVFRMESKLSLVKTFEDLNIKSSDIESFVTPVALLSIPSYYDHKVVGFYPTVCCQLSSLILLGYDRFLSYVEQFAEATNSCEDLMTVLKDNYPQIEPGKKLTTIESISYLVDVINKNRVEFKNLVSVLKLNRPAEITREVEDLHSLFSDNLERFFIAYLGNCKSINDGYVIYNYYDSINLSAFNLNIDGYSEIPSDYDEQLNQYCSLVQEHDLALVFNMMNRKFKYRNQFKAYSTLYDLLYTLLQKWGVS